MIDRLGLRLGPFLFTQNHALSEVRTIAFQASNRVFGIGSAFGGVDIINPFIRRMLIRSVDVERLIQQVHDDLP